jgi:hypothetical protein
LAPAAHAARPSSAGREGKDWVLMRVAGVVLAHTAAAVPVIISLTVATHS